jgi:DNA-directed RNA polymerase subunit beta'
LANGLIGRIIAKQVKDPQSGEVLAKKGELLDDEAVDAIFNSKVEEVAVYSPLNL